MKIFSFFNSVLLLFLILILSISYYEEFVYMNEPCSLCILQRFFIVGIGVPLTFNITGSACYKNVAASVVSCVLGSVVSLYQWSQLLINNGVSNAPKLFTLPIYIWAAILFFSVALILLLLSCILKETLVVKRTMLASFAYYLFLAMVASQIIVTFSKCGVFLC
jgi:disulfide bond formation protein DsbB